MPTDACNLACDYCYVLNKPETRMSEDLARRTVDQVLGRNDPSQLTRFIWHGGEPLMAGLEFYRSICRYVRDAHPRHRVEHLLQTNGTLLRGPWIDFFLEEDFKVGISLDGDKWLHDAHRRTREGCGSFDIVLRNAQDARARGLITGFICVLTRQSLPHAREIYEFFHKRQFDFSFHGVTSLTPQMVNTLSITPAEYAQASVELFDLGFYQPEPRVTDVSPSLHYLRSILLGHSSGYCVMAEKCGEEYISVEPDGNVSVCDRFAGNPAMSFGNLSRDPLETILQSPVRQQLLHRWEALRNGECAGCAWGDICHGGCPHEAWAHRQTTLARDANCSAYRQIYQHVADVVLSELDKGRRPA
jgi:uncharacterized protein